MKYFLAITLLAIILFNPAFAQSKNPSLIVHNEEIPYYDFNRVARDTVIIEFSDLHGISWQVVLDNDLMYANPDGNAVLRFYDVSGPETFIEMVEIAGLTHRDGTAVEADEVSGNSLFVVFYWTFERAGATLSLTDMDGERSTSVARDAT